jgi:hypothetical protein
MRGANPDLAQLATSNYCQERRITPSGAKSAEWRLTTALTPGCLSALVSCLITGACAAQDGTWRLDAFAASDAERGVKNGRLQLLLASGPTNECWRGKLAFCEPHAPTH